MRVIEIFDSTLRDGEQGAGISFTMRDKIAIVKKLDKLGVSYIEAGNPFSNPTDMEFFKLIKENPLINAKLVAFGATRRKDIPVAEDKNVQALLDSGVSAISIVGKSSTTHVLSVLNTTLDENLSMIYDTINYLKHKNKTVIFDAEHFFDGYNLDESYAIKTLLVAQDAGADVITLCDTNGSAMCEDIKNVVEDVMKNIKVQIGIHCHNDIGYGVANSITAVNLGVSLVQGTYLGFGERCGNANLSTIIPILQLKLKYSCIPDICMKRLTKTATFIAEIANLNLDNSLPYVGKNAFSHKGGMHVDGVQKLTSAFEHIEPESVGNKRNILVSEVSGRAVILNMINDIDNSITKNSKQAEELVTILKELEHKGYLYETATASLELVITKHLNIFKPFFELVYFKVIGEQLRGSINQLSTALIKINVGDKVEITAAEGEGPVHALDIALRKAVQTFYPSVKKNRLVDYKVRVIESTDATAALVRVIITSTDGEAIWTTVGVSRDIIDASLQAIMDSVEYQLLMCKRVSNR